MKSGSISRLINLIESKLPANSGEVEVCFDIQDLIDKAGANCTLGEFINFCANNGLTFHAKSGRWVMPFFSINKEGGELVHG